VITVSTATAFTLAAILGPGGAALAVASRYWPWWRHRPAAAPAPALGLSEMPVGWRYCPDELRQRAAVLHANGSARCLDCGTHIPAGDL